MCVDYICKCVGWVSVWKILAMLTIFSNVDDSRLERMRAWEFCLATYGTSLPLWMSRNYIVVVRSFQNILCLIIEK